MYTGNSSNAHKLRLFPIMLCMRVENLQSVFSSVTIALLAWSAMEKHRVPRVTKSSKMIFLWKYSIARSVCVVYSSRHVGTDGSCKYFEMCSFSGCQEKTILSPQYSPLNYDETILRSIRMNHNWTDPGDFVFAQSVLSRKQQCFVLSQWCVVDNWDTLRLLKRIIMLFITEKD